MAHNIDQSNNRANIAFRGSRNDVWHKMGQEMEAGMSVEEWAAAAGLNWTAIPQQAFACVDGEMIKVEDRFFNVRSDTKHVLGSISDRFQNVQPIDVLKWFERYTAVDDRFELDVAGSLKQGEIIWATATFNGDITVAGERHRAHLLMSTAFDGSAATTNQCTVTRVVCNNTLNAAQYDKSAVVRTRHNTKFDAAKVAKELATVAKSVEVYKMMGDALAQAEMAKTEVADFFKAMLDIPADAQSKDITTRKTNQYMDLARAYQTTLQEGAEPDSAWAALQAVTRYVDHDRTTRGSDSETEGRFAAAQFGSGAAFKDKAMQILMPRIKDRVLLPV